MCACRSSATCEPCLARKALARLRATPMGGQVGREPEPAFDNEGYHGFEEPLCCSQCGPGGCGDIEPFEQE